MRNAIKALLLAALVAGLGLRLVFAWQLPFTNDEGAYLLDAKLLVGGAVAGGDVLSKSPVSAVLFATSVWLSEGSLFAGRGVVVLANLLTTIPLAYLAWRLRDASAAIMTTLLWLLIVPISMTVFGITQPIAALFVTACLAFWYAAPESQKHYTLLNLLAGLSFALAFMSRRTSLALLVPAAYLWFITQPQHKKSALLISLVGVVIVGAPWLAILFRLYDLPGVLQALGIDYGDLIYADESAIAGQASLTWPLTVLARTGSGLVLAATIGLGWSLTKLRRNNLIPALPLLWLLALVGLYVGWPVFLPEYLIDFFAPLTLLAGLALTELWQRRARLAIATLILITLASLLSYRSVIESPWTGMFTKEAVAQASGELQARIPLDEPVFTAAVIIPYMSGHSVLFDIAHPLWYTYDSIPAQTKQTFLPPLATVEQQISEGPVQWALVEHLTDYAYLRSESQLISLFGREWKIVTTIPNKTGFRSNTLQLYQREECDLRPPANCVDVLPRPNR